MRLSPGSIAAISRRGTRKFEAVGGMGQDAVANISVAKEPEWFQRITPAERYEATKPDRIAPIRRAEQ